MFYAKNQQPNQKTSNPKAAEVQVDEVLSISKPRISDVSQLS